MTFTLPAAHHAMNTDPDVDARQLANINGPTAVQTKAAGNLPITNVASQWRNNGTPGAIEGVGWEFQASQAAYDVSSDTYLMLWHEQFNAPNRIQVGTVAQGGVRLRVYSGTGSMPTDYKEYYLGGSDSPFAECIKGQYPFVVDLNDTSEDVENGTFDNTDVTSYALVTRTEDMAGTNDNWCYPTALYLIRTTKTSSDTPTFTGTSSFQDAVDEVQGTDYTDKIGNWVRKIGDVVFIDMPFRIGDNSTETDFDDNGITIVSPAHNDSADPRVRVTTDAFRTYLNLRNNAADTAAFSGTYIWQVRSAFDWDQDDSAAVTFSSPTFRGMGPFTLGSSITGPATWDDVDEVVFADTGVDVDGSTFRNPNGNHALEMTAGAMDIADMRFESYSGAHAILIDTAGTYNFSNVFFDESGTNEIETTHASGTVTINISNGGTVPGVTETGAGDVVVNNNVTVSLTVLDSSASPIQNARVLIEAAAGGALPAEDSVSITRSGSTATVTHTGHGLSTGDDVSIRGADQGEYNGTQTITVTGTNTYTYTVSGSPTTPATGTITSTFQIVNELTNVSGVAETTTFNYTADQPISGRVRKAGTDPRYKPASLTGTITSAGFAGSITAIAD